MADLSYRCAESTHDLGNLRLRSFRLGDTHVIAVGGAFDGWAKREVERELEDADGTASQVILLDLRILEFIEAGKLRVVVLTAERPMDGDSPD